MNNLLRANFSRLKQDKVFWVCMAAMLAGSAGMMVGWCRADLALGNHEVLEYYYFRMVLPLGLIQSVFACLFLHVEYSEGTIRNKLAIGHTRAEIYLANFLAVLLGSLLMLLALAAGGLAGIPLVGVWRFGFGELALYLLIAAACSAVFAAVYTFIGMLMTGRSSTVVTVVVWIVLLFAAAMVYNALSEPEFHANILITAEGKELIGEPNPKYLTGTVRVVYEFLYDLLPTGLAVQVQSTNVAHPVRALACDAALTAAFTLGGLALFRRKDLK